MLLSISVIVLVVLELFLATFVLARSRSRFNLAFSIFTLVSSLWVIANYVGANFKGYHLASYFVRADFVLGALAAYVFWFFTLVILEQVPKERTLSLRQHKLVTPLCIITVMTMAAGLLNLVANITASRGQPITITYTFVYIVYAVILSLMTILGGINISLAYRNSYGSFKQQVATMSRGLILGVGLVVIANFIVPILTDSKATNLLSGNAAYLGIFAFVAATAYAIVRHKLFDVRLVVARSIAYGASIISLAAIYGFVIFGTAQVVFSFQISPKVQIFLSLATAIASLTFQRLKKFFDLATNSLFYRDAYDPQNLFQGLNEILVSTLDLDVLLNESAKLISRTLKTNYIIFMLKETSHTQRRIVATANSKNEALELSKLASLFRGLKQNVIVTDLLEAEEFATKQTLIDSNVSIVINLLSSVNKTEDSLGLMVLGSKRSGNPYNSQDVKVLETAANELIIAIQNALHFEEIQNFNVTLQDKVDDATRKLRRVNEKLKALDESKDDFISMASHQLRTPLTSIKGYISMVLEGDAGKVSPMQHEMLGQAFFSSQRMVYLISDLLNVSRLKTGKFIIERNKVNLATMVAQELDQLKETAAARQLTLTHEAPDNFPDLMIDETKTRQVIMNFVDNAIYYTPAGGHINVKLIDNPTSIELRVIDDGIGVSKADQHHLFTKFYRAGNARKARPDGTGLGLFMAKKVIIAEEGSLIFESSEGKGSTFGFVFYKSKAGVTK